MLSHLSLESVRDRALMMRAMPTFAGVDDDSLALIASHARTRTFAPGASLARADGPLDRVYAVVRGRVRASRGGVRVRLPDPAPSMIGLLPVLARDARGIDVVAEEEVLALELPTQVILDVLEEHFAVVRYLMRVAATTVLERLRVTGERAGSIGELLVALPSKSAVPRGITRAASKVDAVLAMRASPMFERADLDALFAIVDQAREVRLEPGEQWWREGDRVRTALVIEEGVVRCESSSGHSVLVEPPSVLGRVEALAEVPARYGVRAETRVYARSIELSAMFSVLEVHFELARCILAALSGAVLELSEAEIIDRVRDL